MSSEDSFIYIIFGASGDLTKRKLVPALFDLFQQNLLPKDFVILGVARSSFKDESFRELMKEAIREFAEIKNPSQMDSFLDHLFYQSIMINERDDYARLSERLEQIRQSLNIRANYIYYLSTPPSLYGMIPKNLAAHGLNLKKEGWKRLIIEKPFGYDLDSALKLKESLLSQWKEEQLYRIDHYLGKETVQNLLVTRFSNGIFEPLWNSKYVHHIEITSAESIGVEQRGGYYESSGALRDMLQNHLFQVAAITAMEPPSSLDPKAIRYEILKVFQSLRPIRPEDVGNVALRGQYLESLIGGEPVHAYRQEKDVHPESTTETYAAMKFYIDNWRWGGIPFYIRTGKRLPTRVTEVVIHFKPTPHFLFSSDKGCDSCNQLIIRIQPDEGILLNFGMKEPGSGFEVRNVNMEFHYSSLGEKRIPSAYERLIYDSIIGDSTLFARTEEIIEAWKFLSPVQEAWKNDSSIPLHGYPAGSWGPETADHLIEGEMSWRYPCKMISDEGTYCSL